MIDSIVLKEILREAFQDFELLDYEYSVLFTLGVVPTNDGSLVRDSRYYNNYKILYKYNLLVDRPVTYKDFIRLYFNFKPIGIVNIIQFDDFFLDGMTKLNHLLERYRIRNSISGSTIVFPKRKIRYNKTDNRFFKIVDIFGEEKEIIVEFSSRLKNKS